MDLIAGFVERYLRLTEQEELVLVQELDKVLDMNEKETVMEVMTSWE